MAHHIRMMMTHVWMMVMRVRIRVPTWWRRTAMRTWMHHVWWGRHPTGGRWDRPSVMPGRWTLRRSWWGALRRSFPSRTNASSLPGLIGNSHRKICSLLILDLAAFVDQCLRTCIVQALNTFTLVTADHTSLETLAILFQTFRLFALATHVMYFLCIFTLRIFHNESRLECFGVLGPSVLDCFLPNCPGLWSISTI